MKQTISFLILFYIIFPLSAKTTYHTQKKDTIEVSNNNVNYRVTHDKNNLYLHISTLDHKVIQSMLRSGITVFFDIKGKKKKNVFIKYPSNPNNSSKGSRPKGKREENSRTEFNSFEDINKQDERIVKLIEDDFPQEAEYKYFDSKIKFNILLNRLDISALLNYNRESKVFNYKLKVPKDKINADPKKNLSKLMIGIKTNSMKQGEYSKGKPSLNVGGRGSGGQEGGQRGGGQGGEQGGQRNGPPSSDERSNSKENKLNFWFKVNFLVKN
jgi:hypothetical protein